MAAEKTGTVVRWVVNNKSAGIGYFQKWSLPVPGDRVVMDLGEPDEHLVEVLYRVFEQPEANLPLIWIHARRIAADIEDRL